VITAAELAAWLCDNGLPEDVLVTLDGEIPEMPDRCAVLTRTGGPGTVVERAYEVGAVQIVTRDGQGSASGEAAETLADLVDSILMAVEGAIAIGGKRVISVDQEGGPPAFLDRDDGDRVLYVCSYLFQVARAQN
jgi:hypothetical protein